MTKRTPSMDRASVRLATALVALYVLVHLAVVGRYGYHGDELYFVECGRHLAFGYVDHAPLIPWIARAADALGGASLLALRLPVIAAGAGTMLLVALLVHEWGGGSRAQAIALVSILFAPAYLRMGTMLNIPAIEVFLCTASAYFVARALGRDERWPWLAAGAVAGVGLLAKHTVLLWGAGLAIGLLVDARRRALASKAPWIGLAIALLFLVPNSVWQARHGFPTLEFAAGLRRDILEHQGRALFVLGQLLYFHPAVVPVWLAGLVFAFTPHGRPMRPFAVLFLFVFAVLLIAGGKPY